MAVIVGATLSYLVSRAIVNGVGQVLRATPSGRHFTR